MSHTAPYTHKYHRTSFEALPNEEWDRFRDIQAEVGNNLAEIETRLDSEDLSDEDRMILELLRNAILVASWKDENGLLTGALQYVTKEKLFSEDESNASCLLIWLKTDAATPMWPGRLYCLEVDIGQTFFFRTGGVCPYVRYLNERGDIVHITPLEANVRSTLDAVPYQTYRPFLCQNGSTVYRLVREIKLHKYDVDGVPAYLNYLIVKASKRVYQYLEARGVDVGDVKASFTDVVLGERRLPEFNEMPTGEEHADWLKTFNVLMDELENHDVFQPQGFIPLKGAMALITEKAKQLHALILDGEK